MSKARKSSSQRRMLAREALAREKAEGVVQTPEAPPEAAQETSEPSEGEHAVIPRLTFSEVHDMIPIGRRQEMADVEEPIEVPLTPRQIAKREAQLPETD